MRMIVGCLALLGVVLVLQDAFEVMLLPRRVRRRRRITRLFFRSTWRAWSGLSGRIPQVGRREHWLSLFGPLAMLMLFAIWAGTLIAGFGTLGWALEPARGPGADSPYFEQLYMSGVTFFTLGYGDVVPHSNSGRLVSVLEAGFGIGFIAVVIGYLPVLYQLFTRREAHVIQLDGRAGSPPTATTLLVRHAEGGGLEQMNGLFREWEAWGSELLESHLSYPMLAYYRSQHDNQSWLAGLACIMDACALVLVGVPELPPLQARMTFTMGRQILVEMAQSFTTRPSRYDGGDRLDHASYVKMEAALAEAGVKWEDSAEAEATLAALRATYEPLLDGLAKYLLLNVPTWMPAEGAMDHWEKGHRGLIAKRLLEDLGDRESRSAQEVDEGPLWQRLRSQVEVTPAHPPRMPADP